MAKKKKTSTKGLAGIPVYGSNAKTGKDIRLNKKVKPKKLKGGYNYLGDVETVTVPKQWLSSPDHVVAELAYITPAEQKILIDANLYGSLSGKPNRAPGGLMSLQGDLGGGSYGGGSGDDAPGTDSAAESASAAGASNDYSSSQSNEDPLSAFGGAGADIEDIRSGKATVGPLGMQDGDPYYAYRDRQDRADAIKNIQSQTGVNLPGALGGIANLIGNLNRKAMIDALERGAKPVIVKTKSGDEFVRYVEFPDGRKIGTVPTPLGGGDDGPPTLGAGLGGTGGLGAGEATTATAPVTPDSYYGAGVGSATMNLGDPIQREAFLAGIYGDTPSPIGSKFDKEKGLLYLPDGSVVDIKTGKKIKERRISGLDIFKPLQTYA